MVVLPLEKRYLNPMQQTLKNGANSICAGFSLARSYHCSVRMVKSRIARYSIWLRKVSRFTTRCYGMTSCVTDCCLTSTRWQQIRIFRMAVSCAVW